MRCGQPGVVFGEVKHLLPVVVLRVQAGAAKVLPNTTQRQPVSEREHGEQSRCNPSRTERRLGQAPLKGANSMWWDASMMGSVLEYKKILQ